MRRARITWTGRYRLLVVLAVLAFGASGSAETRWTGTAGFDLAAYGFNGAVHGTSNEYSTTRSMSNHYLDMNLAGTVANNNFLSYMLRGKVLGTFSQSSTGDESNNFYLSPDLNAYYGSAVFFPERRYPLRLYLGRQLDRELEYESQNRSNTEALQPSLSVVRRYRRETRQKGAVFNLSLNQNASFLAQIKDMESSSLREYDFGENNDLWVDIITYPPNPLVDRHRIEILNKLPGVAVRVFVDGIDTTIAPDSIVDVVVDAGRQSVLIVPLKIYNQFEFATNVEGEQSWKIVYNEPPSPRDQNSEETGSRFQVDLGDRSKKSLNAFYDHTNRFDPFSGQTTSRDLISNAMGVALSKNDQLDLETSYSSNESVRGGEVTQSNSNISHETSFEHTSRRGLSAMLVHEFSRANTAAGGTKIETDLHRIRARAGKPFRKYDYRVELEANASLKSDNVGTGTDQIDTKLINRMTLSMAGFAWRPQNSSSYTIRNQSRQDGSSSQTKILETNFRLDVSSIRSTALGDLAFKSEYGYRDQSDAIGSDTKTVYGFEFLLARRIVTGFSLNLLVIQRWESYGGNAPLSGPNIEQTTLTRPTDHKQTWRADFKIDPTETVALGLSYSLVDERLSQITQTGANLSMLLPLLRVPVTSTYSQSNRDIGDLPRQTVTSLKTELKYNYRQIVFSLEHSYSKEKLVAQTFSFYEVIAQVSRNLAL